MRSLDSETPQSWLSWFFKGLLVLGFIILVGRLAELQVIKGAYYRNLSEGNRVRRVSIAAPRGKIYDANGELLVGNKAIDKTVVFDPIEGYEKKIANEHTPQDEIIIEWQRKYLKPVSFSHITGYIGEVDKDEVGKIDPNCPDKGARGLGSYIGRGGLEQYYDCLLRGVPGEELVEVDTKGNKIRTLGRKQAVGGEDIHITIDYKLQAKIEDIMEQKPGAVIVTTPMGEVKALVSNPGYDPNSFVNESLKQKVTSYFQDESLPLFNRAIGGKYHPGSIFKMVTNTAAVEEGEIDEDFTYEDTGVIVVDEYQYNNWYFTQYGGTEGVIDPIRALARSTDTFYYKVGELVGPDKLAEWSEKFGLAQKTGIDLPGEVAGLIPNPEWKRATKGENWFLGNTYHMSIGQGDLAVTPIEAHRIAGVFASNGKLCSPFVSKNKQINCSNLGISKEALDLSVRGMVAACDAEGTAYPFVDFTAQGRQNFDVACKTGTAETFEEDITHAWFTLFAPVDDPEIVLTVLLEKGGEGSSDAAPIAREIMDYIFNP